MTIQGYIKKIRIKDVKKVIYRIKEVTKIIYKIEEVTKVLYIYNSRGH